MDSVRFASERFQEATIIRAMDHPERFARCSNSKCRTIFITNSEKIFEEAGFLCPECRRKMQTHHFVQCSNCQTIVSFIPAETGEEPVVFNIEKCCNCFGTVEDEIRVVPSYFPDAYI